MKSTLWSAILLRARRISLSNEKTRAREILGLQAGMRSLGVPEGWIVTMDEEDEVAFEGGVVHIVPAWKWLLD